MHIHILGICGTFMGGVAALAKAAGHRVSGSDLNVYPPMSTQLSDLGIEVQQGYLPRHLDPAPDCVVVGNVMSRGNEAVEYLLDSGIPYSSGPEWLHRNVLRDRWVLAIAGTHGKTTTASILAWILDHAGFEPGFLIGGIPVNFGMSARLGQSPFFVVEADEYDCAFFDKRAKFVHYHPRTLVLNNLELDHADIYPDLQAIAWQFHQLLRTVPRQGKIILNAGDANLQDVLEQGCWTPTESFSASPQTKADWRQSGQHDPAFRDFEFEVDGKPAGRVVSPLSGVHNLENILAAMAAARHAGVPVYAAVDALAEFRGVKRRMEVKAETAGITIYDDFAHHPTAIAKTLDGLRRIVGGKRVVAVLEPRSNTMRMGVHGDRLPQSLCEADRVWMYKPPNLTWNIEESSTILGDKLRIASDVGELVRELVAELRRGDQVLVMSNGDFGGLHARLIAALGGTGRHPDPGQDD